MSTRHSPLNQLRAEADRIAATMKAAERGEVAVKGNARNEPSVKFGVVMDDKVLTIDIAWAKIAECSEAGLSDYILELMREERRQHH